MIYTIGYEKLTVQQLIQILKEYKVDYLFDVRSNPHSKREEFSKINLQRAINQAEIDYHWLGATLGGRNPINEDAIFKLHTQGRFTVICLLCLEHIPQKCHRYNEIAMRLAAAPYESQILHLVPVIDKDLPIVSKVNKVLTGNQAELF